jgi:Anti-sigma factor NepR
MGGLRHNMPLRFNSSADLKAVLTGIGRTLRSLFSNALREPIPDGMASLLRQLDQPEKDDGPAGTH